MLERKLSPPRISPVFRQPFPLLLWLPFLNLNLQSQRPATTTLTVTLLCCIHPHSIPLVPKMVLGADSPHPMAPATTIPAMTFTPIEPKLDTLVFLRRDSASSHGSSHTSSATPTNTSPRPNANPLFTPGFQLRSGSSSPPLTPVPNSLLYTVDEEPNTPSSTIVEFGDLAHGNVPSAAELVTTIHRSLSESHISRSGSRSMSMSHGAEDGRESRENRHTRDQSRNRALPAAIASKERSHSERDPTGEKGLADERINRFLHSMAQQSAQGPEGELVQENRSLYQRIAALQRTERELLAENQELTRKFTTLKQHHDCRARQWSEGLQRKETGYAARIREMSEQLLDLPHTLPAILSNEQISSWFDDQDAAWNSWSRAFGHHDPERLSNGLHPLQLQEICDNVKGFVRMTDGGSLPPELVHGGKEAIHTLLNGMLANFICTEILASPLWVFDAISLSTLESPSTITSNPLPGLPVIGFRMDKSAFSEVAPLRPGRCPTPRSPQFPPPLITSMMPPALGTGASFLRLPGKADVEHLIHMLTDGMFLA